MDYLSKQGRLVFLHLANGSSYAINTDGVNDLPSHLRYYKLHGLVMTRNGEISKRNETVVNFFDGDNGLWPVWLAEEHTRMS